MIELGETETLLRNLANHGRVRVSFAAPQARVTVSVSQRGPFTHNGRRYKTRSCRARCGTIETSARKVLALIALDKRWHYMTNTYGEE